MSKVEDNMDIAIISYYLSRKAFITKRITNKLTCLHKYIYISLTRLLKKKLDNTSVLCSPLISAHSTALVHSPGETMTAKHLPECSIIPNDQPYQKL